MPLENTPNDPRPWRPNFNLQEAVRVFTFDFAILQEFGAPVIRSLYVLAETQQEPNLKAVLLEVARDTEQLEAFSKAIAKHPNVFGNAYRTLMDEAEVTGMADVALRELVDARGGYNPHADEELSAWAGHVAMTLSNGSVLYDALATALTKTSGNLREVLKKIQEKLANGLGLLSESLGDYPRYFDAVDVAIVAIGEDVDHLVGSFHAISKRHSDAVSD